MESRRIRQTFLDFFKEKGHQIVPSAPMVVKDDPTLMFINAGMNPFKDLFLGNQPVEHARIADTQKCLRVSGKHNDLEEVGVDTYHHTLFEMLGNWSFGDYFKAEAIDWAWELLTNRYGLDKDRLYVTVFGGDQGDGLPADDEARAQWQTHITDDRILAADKKDNFWEMGETGPCGPCSEIHVDLRSDEERAKVDGRDLVNEDHPQVIEIWNLVFMEFNRMADGSLVSLPNKHIDTGMGFERLAMAMQGVTSNYDTDIFTPLLDAISKACGKPYPKDDSQEAIAFRVIADHVRAVAFSIADGQLPSNTGAGYVIRRILRRAVRYGSSFLGMNEPFIHQLVVVLDAQMSDTFPEIKAQRGLIEQVIEQEEQSFLRTLASGMERLTAATSGMKEGDELKGDVVFELYDTFGFPVDLTALIASEQKLKVDESGFQALLDAQKNRSREAGKITADDWKVVAESDGPTEFIGYDHTKAQVALLRYREVTAKKKTFVQAVFDRSPFYPEGGGQVGDRGTLTSDNGEAYQVLDTKKENNLIVHVLDRVPSGASFQAQVNTALRASSARNHSATHLLHEALREVLGTHVEQKGSLVKPDGLRFDFSHFQKVNEDELAQIEALVQRRILANLSCQEHRNMAIADAQAAGAMMLFGEKYGDTVRMIEFGSSKELCGGIHVPATGAIGPFRIESEGAVAAGIRRIEALTGDAAMEAQRNEREQLVHIRGLLKGSADPAQAIGDLLKSNAKMTKDIEAFQRKAAGNVKGDLIAGLKNVNGVQVCGAILDLDAKNIKDLAFQLKAEHAPFFGVFGSCAGGKVTLSIAISDDVVAQRDLHAGNLVRELAVHIGGGGGGQAFFATAGGKNADGLQAAIDAALAKVAG
ncbi:MAG TPA: alanine--tRNA ligase [Flavobacteriales bacterium]|nr:alanine--tRNA ligase [Flavobacteriales bacterium]